MYCLNCGEEIEEDCDDDDDAFEDEDFCSEECREEYMAKVGFILFLGDGG
ncbi:MAG: hypothetical protein WCP72_11600 [Desulfomonile sp.]